MIPRSFDNFTLTTVIRYGTFIAVYGDHNIVIIFYLFCNDLNVKSFVCVT